MKKTFFVLTLVMMGVCAGAQAADNASVAKTLARCSAFMKVSQSYAAKNKLDQAAKDNGVAAEGMKEAAIILMGKNDTAVAFVNDQITTATPEIEKMIAAKDSAGMKKQLQDCQDVHAKAQAAYKAMQPADTKK